MVTRAGMSDEAVKNATGRDWIEWRARLDASGAAELAHGDIVQLVLADGITDWWSQMVTVGYERMIGKRAHGERCDGKYSANASRTVSGNKDEVLAKWLSAVNGKTEFDGAVAEDEPRQSHSPNWRYWKVNLDNGSRVDVVICDKADGKATIGISHEKLSDAEASASAKLFWKALLATV